MEDNKFKISQNVLIGKVRYYNGYIGQIVTYDNIYYFDKNDTITDVKDDDVVLFKGKEEDIFPQAYYIKSLSLKKKNKS